MTTTLERKIKKNLYGKAQRATLIFPPGFADIALDETTSILNNLWFPQKFSSQIQLRHNEIRIENIHMSTLLELIVRCTCLSDIRLVIFEGKAIGKTAFEKKCRSIFWDMFITQNMPLKIQVDSVASKAFHETGLKEIISNILRENGAVIQSGEQTHETTRLYVDLYNDRLTLRISLAGSPLYKRGYRGTLSASAPLREDFAACCIRQALHFAEKIKIGWIPDTILVPFSGTGTFVFEYLISRYQLSPPLLGRSFAFQSMPFYRENHYHFLLKKSKEHCFLENEIYSENSIVCIDQSEKANQALLDNFKRFQNALSENSFSLAETLLLSIEGDFMSADITDKVSGNVFIPLNPPYGIRLGKNNNAVHLYKNIAKKINTISEKNILGFILCPNKETWSAFCKALTCKHMETYHFTQGGIDIRVCQFFI